MRSLPLQAAASINTSQEHRAYRASPQACHICETTFFFHRAAPIGSTGLSTTPLYSCPSMHELPLGRGVCQSLANLPVAPSCMPPQRRNANATSQMMNATCLRQLARMSLQEKLLTARLCAPKRCVASNRQGNNADAESAGMPPTGASTRLD
jgi:hypothetical protein